ncbi:MAG: hypothetical protein IKO72_15355 [Kiritimatiellae bacterium]|nr:hypothetical protein [Kiritimatiellia bacterium]
MKTPESSLVRSMRQCLAAIMLMAAGMLPADTYYWKEDVGGEWKTGANWVGGSKPGSGDIADFSVITGDKTVNLGSAQEVSEIVYIPAVTAGATNKLTFTGSQLSVITRVAVGEQALLDTACNVVAGYPALYKSGAGEWRITAILKGYGNAARNFLHEEGLVTLASTGNMQGMSLRTSSDPSKPIARFVMEEGCIANPLVGSKVVSDWEPAFGDGSRSIIDMRGGTLVATNFGSAGCFLNAHGHGSYGLVDISGGVIDGQTKTFYVSFYGTGVVHQTGGQAKWNTVNLWDSKTNIGNGAYELLGGELWLGSKLTLYAGAGSMTASNALIGAFGDMTISTGSPLNIEGTVEFNVLDSFTCTFGNHAPGAGGIIKTGTGSLVLGGHTKQFTGPVVVSNGTFSIGIALSGQNDFTVAGGTLNATVPANIKSMTICGTGVVAAASVMTLPANARVVTVRDNGVLDMSNGFGFTDDTVLVIEDDGKVRIPSGMVRSLRNVTFGGVAVADGAYVSGVGSFVTGGGTLLVGTMAWSGLADDGLWSSPGNWQAGISPLGQSVGIDLSAASGEITQDGGVVVSSLSYDAAGDAMLTNRAATAMHFAEGAVITVGEGDTLALAGPVVIDGATLYKRGKGTLVFCGGVSTAVVNSGPYAYLYVQEGRCEIDCAMSSVSIVTAQLGSIRDEGVAETVFLDNAVYNGTTYVAGPNRTTEAFPNPGCGIYTQLGGTVTPASSWGTAMQLCDAPSGQSVATGTYHLVSGTLNFSNKTLTMGSSPSVGIFRQDGGTSLIGNVNYGVGWLELNGGTMSLAGAAASSYTFRLSGGTFTTHASALVVPVAWSLLGNTTFDVPANSSITFNGSPTGEGSFTKAGAGALSIPVAHSNDVTVVAGTLQLPGALVGDIVVSNGATLHLTGTSTATGLTYGDTQMQAGLLYTSNNCAFITGEGSLAVGEVVLGRWTGEASDGQWSSSGNWVNGVLPSGSNADADLSLAAGTLQFDLASHTLRSLTYAPTAVDGVLTNSSPAESSNTLNIFNGGEVFVEEGRTLVLDHLVHLDGGGSKMYKRGRGTLVLRRGMSGTASRDNYLYVESGRVITEGSVENVMLVPSAPDRSDPDHTPEFVIRGENASVGGTTALYAMNSSATDPGNGRFRQEGGVVEPNHSYGVHGILGFAAAAATAGGTGTYHLVNGTLRIKANKSLEIRRNKGYGVFIQDGGLFECNGTFATSTGNGEIFLNGGRMRLNAMSGNRAFTFTGGVFNPLATAFSFTAYFNLAGVGEIEVDEGKTMTFTLDNPLRGAGLLKKTGKGTMTVSSTGSLMTGSASVDAGTLEISGRLRNVTNVTVAADATLSVACNASAPAVSATTALKVDAGGRVALGGTGTLSIDSLMLDGMPQRGRGRRYGSSDHAGEVDVVDDVHFSGTGVLVVTGRTLLGTTLYFK